MININYTFCLLLTIYLMFGPYEPRDLIVIMLPENSINVQPYLRPMNMAKRGCLRPVKRPSAFLTDYMTNLGQTRLELT